MDAQSTEKLKQQEGEASRTTSEKSSSKPTAAREVKKKASEVLQSQEFAEAAEDQAGVELSDGNISETVVEDKTQGTAGGGKKAYTADEIETIRAKLLAALPPQEVMIRQIKQKLYKQEKVLTKRMNKLKRTAHKNAFHLNIVVSQLRKVREYFSMIAHATYEMLKHLWLKIVHGV